MLYIEFNAVNFLIVLFISHGITLFLSWLFHFLQHQTIFGIPFYKVHLRCHHEIRSDDKYTSMDYLYMSIGHSLWLIMILGGFAAYYLLFAPWIAATLVGDTVLVGLFTYLAHQEYDKASSWLDRFKWFRRGRALHKIHHSYFGERFSRSKNYAFGGPVAGNVTDYLLGTFLGRDDESYFPRPVYVLGKLLGKHRPAFACVARQIPSCRPGEATR